MRKETEVFVEIRKASLEDAEEIYRLNEKGNFLPRREIFENCLSSGETFVFVALKNNEIVGFILFGINHTLRKLVIDNLFVKREERRKKIGSKLLKKAVETGTEHKVEYVCLFANRITKFLKRNGFVGGKTFKWFELVL